MTEVLLVTVALAAIVALVLFAMSVALVVMRKAAAYFVLPVEPPPLIRLGKLLEMVSMERLAAEAHAQRRYPPPPEIVGILRAFLHGADARSTPGITPRLRRHP